MPKTRPAYPVEFRRQMVELVRAGRDPTDLAREFEPARQTIQNWVAESDRVGGRRCCRAHDHDLRRSERYRDPGFCPRDRSGSAGYGSLLRRREHPAVDDRRGGRNPPGDRGAHGFHCPEIAAALVRLMAQLGPQRRLCSRTGLGSALASWRPRRSYAPGAAISGPRRQ
jgi:hypothetical protein